MRKALSFLLPGCCLLAVLLLAACGGDPKVATLLDVADSLSTTNPDSALQLLTHHFPLLQEGSGEVLSPSKSQRMRLELIRARAMNKSYVDFTTDSIMKQVADYYDRHGSPNEQMEAHYLLGCTYRDLHEAPQAVDCFLDAISKADTTAADCDYRLLSSTCSQMADIFHRLLLLSNEIDAREKAQWYACLSGDTLIAVSEMKLSSSAYILLNMKDSAETILRNVINFYHCHGNIQEELQASTMLMYIYIGESSRLPEMKRMIDRYDAECSLFDAAHELPPSKRQYYYYKGKYYEVTLQLDSAEYYYRKIGWPGMSPIQLNPMYSGLLDIFSKRHQADSIAKYARLYCLSNDSSLAVNDKQMTAQMASSYNYSSLQKEVGEKGRKAYYRLLMIVVMASVLLILVTVFVIVVIQFRKRQKNRLQELYKLKMKLAETTEDFNRKIDWLEQLEKTHRMAIVEASEALKAKKKEAKALQTEHAESLRIFQELNFQYSQEKETLKKEIEVLTKRIEALKSEKVMSVLVERSLSMAETAIVVQLKDMEKTPNKTMSNKQLNELMEAFSIYYPSLVYDLKNEYRFKQTDMTVCLLTAIGLRPGSIVNLTGLHNSQVTNCRAKINTILFGDQSAATLGKNLMKRYDICP